MFRLYCGLVRDDIWYNYAEVQPITGGTLALMDGADKSAPGRSLNLVKGSVKSLFTKEGLEYELKEEDYKDLKFVDGWKVAREYSRLHTGEDRPKFEEYFFCKVCSTRGNERYTKVEESLDDLIDKGLIDEIFAESPDDFIVSTELPLPIEIDNDKTKIHATLTKINREILSFGQVISLSKNAWANESEANLVWASWDAQIKSIDGLTERELNILKRNHQENFSKKYIVDQDNIDAMNENEPNLGLVAEHRPVSCKHCGNEVGGYVDFTNFFSFLSRKRSGRQEKTVEGKTRSSIPSSGVQTKKSKQTGDQPDLSMS